MAKKTHLKVRMVPEKNPNSKFVYYAKKPTKGEKVKDKLKFVDVNDLFYDQQKKMVKMTKDELYKKYNITKKENNEHSLNIDNDQINNSTQKDV